MPLFTVLDRMIREELRSLKPPLNNYLYTFSMCVKEEAVSDQLFSKLIEMIEDNRYLEKMDEIRGMMRMLMDKYGYEDNDECRELHRELSR